MGAAVGGTTRRGRRRRPVRRAAVAVALIAPTLAGCSAFGGLPTPTPSAPTPTAIATAEMMPSASPTATSAPANPTATATGGQASIATMTGGNGMGRRLVLGAGAVPPGWSDSTPRETGGYRMTICGVDLEPSAPIDGAQKRWQNSPNGPFLEQHVRVYADQTASTVLNGLARAIPSCPGYTATDSSGGSATYTVEPLSVPGASGFVTWRQKLTLPQPTAAATTQVPSPIPSATALTTPTTVAPSPTASAATAALAPVLIQDVAVTKRGTSIILLASYSVGATPQPQVLETAVKAVGPR